MTTPQPPTPLLCDCIGSVVGKRVRLTNDLTRYRPGLIPGILGLVLGYGDYGVMVRYDNGQTLDTLGHGLELVNPEDIAEAQAAIDKRWKELMAAEIFTVALGMHGGFQTLVVKLSDNHKTIIGDKDEARKVLAHLLAAGKVPLTDWDSRNKHRRSSFMDDAAADAKRIVETKGA